MNSAKTATVQNDNSARFMGISTAILFTAIFVLNVVAFQ